MTDHKKVFISYSSLDKKEITWAIELLSEMDISYWKAPEMIPVGSNYAKEIPNAIKQCDVFLLFVSRASQGSIWVEKEIDSAINHRKIIVPVRIDASPLNDLFAFYLNNVQTISYFENKKQGRMQLKERLWSLFRTSQNISMECVKQAPIVEGQMETINDMVKVTSKKRTYRSATAVFSKNPAPILCQYCGGGLQLVTVGTYRCEDCGKENYDYLRTVRNYLEKHGAKSAIAIANATGVPRDSVEHFLKQEFLEIPQYAAERISCTECGAAIRFGTLCDKCKGKNTVVEVDKKDTLWHSRQRR